MTSTDLPETFVPPGNAGPGAEAGAEPGPHHQLRSGGADRRRAVGSVPVVERRIGQRRREPLVLDDVFEDFSSVAFGVALKVTGNREAADAATEEAFVSLWRRPEPPVPGAERGSVRARLADALEGKGRLFAPRPPRETHGEDGGSIEDDYRFAGWLPRGAPSPDPPAVDRAAAADRQLPSVSVVIPTLNEAENLPALFERLPTWIDEVIVVDGNSTDDTIAVATACRPDVRIIAQTGKGKGNALACGFAATTGEITVMLDADGSTDPAEIPRFVAALTNGYDFAKGTRFVTGGGSDDITFMRRLGNWGITTMVNRIWGVKYSDLCYGYNAFWTRSLPPSFADCNGFEVETLMNIRLAASGMKVVEVPSFEADRTHGTSNLKVGRDGRRIMRTILAEWLRPR